MHPQAATTSKTSCQGQRREKELGYRGGGMMNYTFDLVIIGSSNFVQR